ncbi:hypothetical protein BDQ94DRAFT_55494 [Aspergillus welwitschiae]|uniref:Uncharacterized protein n=1 Tax=Aspergillus welwitschiae TaxID=1341132 RepID=A0A3F3PZ64_9EURO|nr:hypothetical protein BDQ94DRAFT_55494 [Aspergillus welwitschiae]RDH31666.1 hypothetical protein BDQ94DRAFT_55494 [Aspergillus welwitschiae]
MLNSMELWLMRGHFHLLHQCRFILLLLPSQPLSSEIGGSLITRCISVHIRSMIVTIPWREFQLIVDYECYGVR